MSNSLIIVCSLVVVLVVAQACNSTRKIPRAASGKASELLQECIKAHGGKKYDEAHYSFIFRAKTYTFHNDGPAYKYTVDALTKDGSTRKDTLTNVGFTRVIAGKPLSLSEKDQKRYGAGLNSVIYFATLPHKLQDPAVNLAYIGTTKIKDHNYEILKVTFDKEGGGQDHDDEYYYWIKADSYLIDYFAYNYQVSGGGVRFRSAYNTRKVGAIVFQDYINYKAPVGTLLINLPKLYEAEQLEQLSVIATEDIKEL